MTLSPSARLRALIERATRLPDSAQESLAAALEDVLRQIEAGESHEGSHRASAPQPMSDEVRRAFEAALAEHQASVDYLKDR